MSASLKIPDEAILERFSDWLLRKASMPEELSSALLQAAYVRRLEAGETLFAAGDQLQDLHFVSQGLVRYFYLTSDGKEFNKNFVSAGGVATSLSAFLVDQLSPFFVQALEDTLIVSVPFDQLRALRSQWGELERLINQFIADLALKKERREASFLLQNASERYEAFLLDFEAIAPRLQQFHIASYLGITPVALSRIRGRRSRKARS